ncbi:MAG: hypothetical protein SNJ79_02650 [Sphingomonadaceae bacterium]
MEKILCWALVRLRESSTWVGLAMIAITVGSDPMQAMHLAQAISFIVGGGLIAAGPVPTVPGDGKEEQS